LHNGLAFYKKGLSLAKFITDLPTRKVKTPINDSLPNENLFITIGDPWYGGILTYLDTHKFTPHLSHDDQWHIRHQAPHYLLIGNVLYQQGINTIIP
jgi:hypothetical protein